MKVNHNFQKFTGLERCRECGVVKRPGGRWELLGLISTDMPPCSKKWADLNRWTVKAKKESSNA
jgi:hypothetical protein